MSFSIICTSVLSFPNHLKGWWTVALPWKCGEKWEDRKTAKLSSVPEIASLLGWFSVSTPMLMVSSGLRLVTFILLHFYLHGSCEFSQYTVWLTAKDRKNGSLKTFLNLREFCGVYQYKRETSKGEMIKNVKKKGRVWHLHLTHLCRHHSCGEISVKR